MGRVGDARKGQHVLHSHLSSLAVGQPEESWDHSRKVGAQREGGSTAGGWEHSGRRGAQLEEETAVLCSMGSPASHSSSVHLDQSGRARLSVSRAPMALRKQEINCSRSLATAQSPPVGLAGPPFLPPHWLHHRPGSHRRSWAIPAPQPPHTCGLTGRD